MTSLELCYGIRRCALALALCFSFVGRASADDELFKNALDHAQQMHLAEDPEWRALLHCRSSSLDRCSTGISTSDFFSSPEAANNPALELEENLKRIYAPQSKDMSAGAMFQCRYPARFAWLSKRLATAEVNLPNATCPEFEEWIGTIRPHGLSLIFPAAFLNNPASAFGHTLIRIDQPNQDEKTRLIAYTGNFAADTQGDGAIAYAFKGVFGGYDGYFSVAPYYDKVKKYSDLEDRDMWEYELSLEPEEVRLLTMHLWELRKVPFTYYYFDDNCAYQLLSLLEVARPSLELSRRFPLWVLPVDTIRAVLEDEEIFRKATFRPSLATKLRHLASVAPPLRKEWALHAADPDAPLDEAELRSLSPADAAASVDLAYETLTYRTARGAVEGGSRDARAWKLLSLRSTLPTGSSVADVPAPSTRPDQGHGSARVGIGAAYEGSRWASELSFRPAFHDQLDPPQGFPSGAQINFLETVVRQEEERGVQLQRFTLLDIESLSPRDQFFHPKSWSVRAGAERHESSRDDNPLVISVEGGPGGSLRLGEGGIGYLLLEAGAQSSTGMNPEWALGIGPRTGLLLQVAPRWRAKVEGSFQEFGLGDSFFEAAMRVDQTVTLSRETALRLRAGRTHALDVWENSVALDLLYYFDPVKAP